MLSPFRFFRSRPDNRIRVDEDDTNYENLLSTAVGSDAEDEDVNDFSNNVTSNTQNTAQNQNASNQTSTSQNNNLSFSNNNDIFGDFSHFNNMGNVPTTSAVNLNNTAQTNSINENNDNNKIFDEFNIFSNNENINLFKNNNSNNKRVGSTGDINNLSKNTSNNLRFHDNNLISSISESQIFNKSNETTDILGINNSSTVNSNQTTNNINKNRINDIFGDFANFQNAFSFDQQNSTVNNNNNTNIDNDNDKDTAKIVNFENKNNKEEELKINENNNDNDNNNNNNNNKIDNKETNISSINEDDNDLFGDFNSHNFNNDNDNIFDNFTPVITENTTNASNDFFNPDFASFTSAFSNTNINNNNTSDTSNIQPPSTSTISINPPPMASSNIIEFDAFNLNSSSPNQKPVSYDLFSTYEPSQNKNINLNNKASFESITNTDITTEYEEELLFNPIMGNDNDNKKENNNNNKIDKTGKNDSINTTNNDNKNNNNNNNSSSSSSSNDKNTLITIDDKKLNKKSSKEHNKNQNNILKENKNTNISTPSTPSTPSKQAVIATATSSMNSNFVSSPSRETPKKSENMKVQTPIKLKNSESIKNDHISSSDARMKLGDNKEISTISTPTTTNNNIQKIENILDLPPDIILHILTFVSLEELPKLAQLCHRFKLLVYNDSIYELKLRLLGIDYISTDEWISMNTPKNKQINSELNNNTERNNHSVSNNQSGFSTSTMNIDELNNYLLTGKKSLLNLDNLNKSNKENPSNKEKQQNNDNKIKDNKKKNEINIFAKDNDRYKISEDFNIFAKEEEYENKNEGMYKLGSNESVDILNIEGPDQNEAELKKEEDKEKDVEITKKDKNKDQLTVDTELNNNDNENDQKEKIVSTQTKLQMSFKKTPREVFKKECKEILQYYLDFKHPVPYKYLIFEDYTNIYDIAKILHRLVKFSKGRFVTEWQTIQNNINTTVADFEDLLQSEFEENYNELDIENLSNIAKAYQELNGGAPLVQYYLSKCQLFYDPKFNFASLAIYKNNISHPSLSSTELQPGGVIALGSDEEIPEPKSPLDEGNDLIVQYTSFINRLISVIRDQFYQIKQIFPYESDALFLFLQRVVDDIISDYLNTTIEHARRLDPSYYITLFSTFLFTTINIVEVIDSWDKEYEKEHPHKGSKFSSQALKGELQSVMEPFTSYTIQDEVDVLKKQYKEEIDKWKTEREKRKKAETGFLDGDVESYKRNVMNTFKSVLLAPAVMTKNLMGKNKKAEASKEKKVHLDDNTITDSLSLELSLNLIHMNKEALKRCQSIMEIMNEDIGKCAEKLFIVLIKYLDSEHIAPSFQLATKQLATNENHGTKNIIHSLVTFFELIHIADLIQQMVHVYYMEDIAKYVDENDFMSEIIVEKKQFERHLDDLVAQGMDKSIQVLIDNIEYTLINELPLDAYNIQSEHQVMDLKPTPTCLKVVEFLSYHSKMIIGVTDKNTINVLYEEISIRLFNIFVKNLKRMQINLLGAGQLICDLNQYCIWASTLRNPATTKIFSVLKEVGNLFIVDTPQDLKRIVLDTDRYGGYLRRDDIDELLKCRTDYKEIQHVIETKDCIIQ